MWFQASLVPRLSARQLCFSIVLSRLVCADLIRDIKDPEHPHTLEELNVVQESHISVQHVTSQTPESTQILPENSANVGSAVCPDSTAEEDDEVWIKIDFTPTVPHCSLATLIGLCLRVKLERNLQQKFKLDICVTEGMHSIEADVNKQINDKERVAAAMENPNLRDMVEECIKEPEY